MFQILSVMFLSEFVKGALLVSILPVYFHQTLHMSVYLIGWAFALVYTGDNLLRGPGGWALDRVGFRLMMSAGLGAVCAAVLMFVWLSSPIGMLAACLLLGIGFSPLWPSAVTGAVEAAGSEARGTVLSWVHAASFAGTGLGPTAINVVLQGGQMKPSLFVLLCLSFSALLVSFWLPQKNPLQARGGSGRKERHPFLRSFSAAFRGINGGFFLVPSMFLRTFSIGVLVPIITLFARQELGLSPAEFSAWIISGGGAMLALLLLAGRWTDAWGSRPMLLIGIPVAAAGTLSFAFVTAPAALFAAVMAVAAGFALVVPAWNALIAQAILEERKGAAWGALLTVDGFGFVAGSVLSGWLWETVSRRSPFLVSGAAMAGLFVVYLFLSFRRIGMVR